MQPDLFLAYPITPQLQTALALTNPSLVSFFTQGRPDYLEIIEQEGVKYIGKWIGQTCDLTAAEQLRLNVKSLLMRLAPNYDYSSNEFVLLAQ